MDSKDTYKNWEKQDGDSLSTMEKSADYTHLGSMILIVVAVFIIMILADPEAKFNFYYTAAASLENFDHIRLRHLLIDDQLQTLFILTGLLILAAASNLYIKNSSAKYALLVSTAIFSFITIVIRYNVLSIIRLFFIMLFPLYALFAGASGYLAWKMAKSKRIGGVAVFSIITMLYILMGIGSLIVARSMVLPVHPPDV